MKKFSFVAIAAMAMLTMACKKNHDGISNPSGKKKQLLSDTYEKGTTTFSYDAAGKLNQEVIVYPSGRVLKYITEHTASRVTKKLYDDNVHTTTYILNLDNGKVINAVRYNFNAQGDTTDKNTG